MAAGNGLKHHPVWVRIPPGAQWGAARDEAHESDPPGTLAGGIVDALPAPFLKGLFHSDGCRVTNRVRAVRPDGTVPGYAYPRWFLSNTSQETLGLAERAPERLDIAYRRNRTTSLAVSRRAAVAAPDSAIGPTS